MNTLTVSIINLDQLRHGVIARHRFDCKGGTIGSGQTSWQLDDPNQSVAPIHCEIRWIEGSFCVIDHCQRTYLNGSATSLGAYPPRRLLEGDQLRVGGLSATGSVRPGPRRHAFARGHVLSGSEGTRPPDRRRNSSLLADRTLCYATGCRDLLGLRAHHGQRSLGSAGCSR